jgi:hypothetical protein
VERGGIVRNLGSGRLELVTKMYRSVSGGPYGRWQRSGPCSQRIGSQGGGRKHRLAPAPGGREGLAAARVEHGQAGALELRGESPREHDQRADPHERKAARLRERARGRDPDTQPVKLPGPVPTPMRSTASQSSTTSCTRGSRRDACSGARRAVGRGGPRPASRRRRAARPRSTRWRCRRRGRPPQAISTVRASAAAWASRTRRTRRPVSAGLRHPATPRTRPHRV